MKETNFIKSSLPIHQSNTNTITNANITNDLNSNKNQFVIKNDNFANSLTGHIKESYTKSMTIVKKTEDSLTNMRNK